jgi:hypothetical protein
MMNNSMHVFLSVCVLIANYVVIWFAKGDVSWAWYTNFAVLVSLGLVQISDNLVQLWKK